MAGRKAYNHDVPAERPLPGDAYECLQLWAAVMEQAWVDLKHDNPAIRHSAREWFKSKRMDVCSFRWICSLLDLDVWRILARVKAVPDVELEPAELRAKMEAGARLKQWRKQHGWTQKDLAVMLGYAGNTYIAELERGCPGIQAALERMKKLGLEHDITLH